MCKERPRGMHDEEGALKESNMTHTHTCTHLEIKQLLCEKRNRDIMKLKSDTKIEQGSGLTFVSTSRSPDLDNGGPGAQSPVRAI